MPLSVVATPIGNLSDASPRMREVLARAELLLCEDTRQTRKLLSALGIRAPQLVRCDAHVQDGVVDLVLARLDQGQEVALVSDAGTPGISDPGTPVVRAALRAGHPVHAVAGPSSLTAALSVCGLPASPVHFLGFPPRKGLRGWLVDASRLPGALVLLESGRRAAALVELLAELMPDREATLCRELTKLHEQVFSAPLPQLRLDETRGEVVVVVGPGEAVQEPTAQAEGDLKSVAAVLAQRWGCSKREAYNRLVVLERD